MSILSDFKSVFGNNNSGVSYSIFDNGDSSESVGDELFSIYSLQSQSITQTNTVAIKPLEQGIFTSDSLQIKPYSITLRGFLYPENLIGISDISDLNTYIGDTFQLIMLYLNDIQLFAIYNTMTFGLYKQLKLVSANLTSMTELPIPEVNLVFMQIQSTVNSDYNSINTGKPLEVQNAPTITN